MPDEIQPIPVGEPEVVYHYTTVDTMVKIVTSGKIWATSISYLNDSTEGEHFLRMVRQRLPCLLAQYQLRDSVLSKLGSEPKPIEERPFIASFSAEGDSLPQWRSYCPQGNGVAIGFRVGCLTRARPPLDVDIYRHEVQFKSVEYMAEDTPDLFLDDCIANVVGDTDGFLALAETLYGKENRLAREHIFGMFAESEACRRKHESFSAEREYRLIISGTPSKFLEFRPVRSTLIPYVQLSIPDMSPLKMDDKEDELNGEFGIGGGYKKLDFVAKVFVGPTSNTDLSIDAVEAFFRKQNLDVRVVPSNCPFRDW
ncbi:MAG: DUF2971 domain-containing protein [Terracidiphilus sp.]